MYWLYLFARICEKLHIKKYVFHILHFFLHKCIVTDANAIHNAQKKLQGEYIPEGDSCITYNEINIENTIDLQIIVPAYNVENYIRDCIDSILSQKTNYRYVVTIVNDGSTDSTFELLEKYQKDNRVTIINQHNKGLSGARNTALKKIVAKYVMFVDSDDELEKNAIQCLMDSAYNNNSDIVEGGFSLFYKDRVLNVSRHSMKNNTEMNDLFGFAWGKVFKSELFRNIQYPEKYWFEDTVCSVILYPMCKRISTISNLVYRYRKNTSGISNSFQKKPKVLDTLYVYDQLLKDREKLHLKMTSADYFIFLRQVIINGKRISTLQKAEINKAVFILSVDLKNRYFKDFHVENGIYEELEIALEDRDYLRYIVCCSFANF